MSHFYGFIKGIATACWQVVNKSRPDEMRDATLADARKNEWYGSPNTYTSILAKPGVERWLRDMYGDCCAEAALLHGEWTEGAKDEAYQWWKQQSTEAREMGTLIHAAIEAAIREKYDVAS